MKNKTINLAIPSLITAFTLQSAPALAVEGLSANVGFTSNYLWRGVTQTDDGAAISGGIDYAADSGFYAGTWVSNVDFSDDASYELDLYLGFGGDINENISYDLGYIYYAYPDSAESDKDNEYDFGEIYAGITFSNITLAANYGIHNDDGAGWADKALYVSADAEFEVAKGLTLNLHLGDYSFDDDHDSGDYTDYGISLSKSGFTLALTDTDLDNDDVKVSVSYTIDLDL
ncbi:TorF family putative porin [Thalassomonas sp. RHCl1]|uniref:TorF family putative porin n=1 Tax=Thalassomonas sp. RHCl1 TaxID=2995320 RepID=UPI00248D05F3|nr:TorF family putative porin [Thalassomonas sp. RHCl1]